MKNLISWGAKTAAISMAAISAPAMADDTNGYGVATAAVTGQYLDNFGTVETNGAAYRTGQDSSFNYTRMGDVAPANFENCSVQTSCIAFSQGGTTGPGFNQTFSENHASLVYNAGGNIFGPAMANSYADLSTGKLGGAGSTGYYQTAFITAQMIDRLTFSIAGADVSSVTNIIVKFQLDGGLSTPRADGAPGLGTPTASVQDLFRFGNAFGQVNFNQAAANSRFGQEETLITSTNASGWVSFEWNNVTPGLTQFTGVYALNGNSQILSIYNSLSGFAQTGGSFAYGNTSSLSFILPDNVTFTSASGTFLSATGGLTAVPEPGTWAMMIFGFGLIGRAMRRRKMLATACLA